MGADVRKVLGISQSGSNYANLDADEKRVVRESGSTSLKVKGHGLAIISESGLYKLIMRSDKPDAKVFQDWVTQEVLPAIRTTGCYALEQGQEMPLPINEVAPSAQPRWRTSPMHTTPTHSLDTMAQLSALTDDIRQRLAAYGEITETPSDDLHAMLRLTEAGRMSAEDESALVMAMLTRETALHAAELAAHLNTRQELNDLRRSIATEREGLLLLLARVAGLDGGPELLAQAANGSLWGTVVKH